MSPALAATSILLSICSKSARSFSTSACWQTDRQAVSQGSQPGQQPRQRGTTGRTRLCVGLELEARLLVGLLGLGALAQTPRALLRPGRALGGEPPKHAARDLGLFGARLGASSWQPLPPALPRRWHQRQETTCSG